MNHDLVPATFQLAQPNPQLSIVEDGTSMMIIWNYEQGTCRNSAARKIRYDFFCRGSSRWSNVMHRDDKRACTHARCCRVDW